MAEETKKRMTKQLPNTSEKKTKGQVVYDDITIV